MVIARAAYGWRPKRRDPRPLAESKLQGAIADLMAVALDKRVIWYAVPNGEDRHIAVAAKLKTMGVRPGVADFAFVLPGGFAAFMELKVGPRKQSVEQIVFAGQCKALGVPYAIARSVDEAKAIFELWGALRARQAA